MKKPVATAGSVSKQSHAILVANPALASSARCPAFQTACASAIAANGAAAGEAARRRQAQTAIVSVAVRVTAHRNSAAQAGRAAKLPADGRSNAPRAPIPPV